MKYSHFIYRKKNVALFLNLGWCLTCHRWHNDPSGLWRFSFSWNFCSSNFSYVQALTRAVNVPLYFLDEKYLFQIGIMLQTYCRGSEERKISYLRSQECLCFSSLLEYCMSLHFYTEPGWSYNGPVHLAKISLL